MPEQFKLGGNGQGGEILIFRADGNPDSDGDATVQLNGELADFRMGGHGVNGDIFLFDADGNRLDDATATVCIDGRTANALLGGNGADGGDKVGRRRRRQPVRG